MDKFLYLIRQYLAASFRFFAKRAWRDVDLLEEYIEVLAATPLNPTSSKIPDGLRYHLLDIYVDEMDKVDEKREGVMLIEELLEPVKDLGRQSPTKAIRLRVKEALADERLADWTGDQISSKKKPKEAQNNDGHVSEDIEVEVEDEWDGIQD